jgi:hypothetical protein
MAAEPGGDKSEACRLKELICHSFFEKHLHQNFQSPVRDRPYKKM